MDTFVARQPILDRDQQLAGYEVLFRSGVDNWFPGVDPTRASARVIHDALYVFGFDALGAGKKLFVNVDRTVLVSGIAALLPVEKTVVEILETVYPDAEVVAACAALKRAGYTVALDDFLLSADSERLVEFA